MSTAASGTPPAGTPSRAAVSSRDADGLTTLIKTPTERSLVLRKERKKGRKKVPGEPFLPSCSFSGACCAPGHGKERSPHSVRRKQGRPCRRDCTHTWALKAVLTALPFLHAGMWVTTAAVSWAKPFSTGRGTDPARAAVQTGVSRAVRVTAHPSAWLITHERRPIALFTLDNLPVLPKGRHPQPIWAARHGRGRRRSRGERSCGAEANCASSFMNIASIDK